MFSPDSPASKPPFSSTKFFLTMSPFYHKEPPNPSSKRCKFLVSTLKVKDAFSNCHTHRGRPANSIRKEEDPASDTDVDEQAFVSAIMSKYMESKCKRKASHTVDSFYLDFLPSAGALFIHEKAAFKQRDNQHEEKEDFFDVGSSLFGCSSAASVETFVSVKTSFTLSSSLNKIDFPDTRRLSIIEEFRHCEGWPFGLCRKALLLPPLPKSPSESWSWHKRIKMR